jgi:alkylation response protein AidB-like acyl-CoA dehydrogenase
MDLSFTPEQEAFRKTVREFIRDAMPSHIKAKAEVDGHFEMEETMEWHKVLYRQGWVAPHWPKEHGDRKSVV